MREIPLTPEQKHLQKNTMDWFTNFLIKTSYQQMSSMML